MGNIDVGWQALVAQIISILLFILLGFLIWLIIRYLRRTKDRSPLDIARTRYAKGKITLEELRRITKELGEG